MFKNILIIILLLKMYITLCCVVFVLPTFLFYPLKQMTENNVEIIILLGEIIPV